MLITVVYSSRYAVEPATVYYLLITTYYVGLGYEDEAALSFIRDIQTQLPLRNPGALEEVVTSK